MKQKTIKKREISVKIDSVVHADMKLAIAQINKATGTSIDLKEFTSQAIKEKIANSQILNN